MYPQLLAISQKANQLIQEGHGQELSGLDEKDNLICEETLDYEPSYLESITWSWLGNRRVEVLKEATAKLHELIQKCSVEVASFTSDRVKVITPEEVTLGDLQQQTQALIDSDWGLAESVTLMVNSHVRCLFDLDDDTDVQQLTPRVMESIARKLNHAGDPRLLRASIRELINDIKAQARAADVLTPAIQEALDTLIDGLTQLAVEPIPVPRHRPEKDESKHDWYRNIVKTTLENSDRKLADTIQAKLVRESVRVLEDDIQKMSDEEEKRLVITQLLSEFSGALAAPNAHALAPMLFMLEAMGHAKAVAYQVPEKQDRVLRAFEQDMEEVSQRAQSHPDRHEDISENVQQLNIQLEEFPEDDQDAALSSLNQRMLRRVQDSPPMKKKTMVHAMAEVGRLRQERKRPASATVSNYQAPPTPSFFDRVVTDVYDSISRDLYFLKTDIRSQQAWFQKLTSHLERIPVQEREGFTRAVMSQTDQWLRAEAQQHPQFLQHAGLVQAVLQNCASGYFIPVEPVEMHRSELPPPQHRAEEPSTLREESPRASAKATAPEHLTTERPRPSPAVEPQPRVSEPGLDQPLLSLNLAPESLEISIWPTLDGRKLLEQSRMLSFMPDDDAVGMDIHGNLVFEPYSQQMQPHIQRLQENLDTYLLHHLFPIAGDTMPDDAKAALLMPAEPGRCTVKELRSRIEIMQTNPRMQELMTAEHPSEATIQRFHDCQNKAMVIGCGPGYARHKHLHPHQNTFSANIDDSALADLTGDISTTIHLLPHKPNFACIYFEHIDGTVFSDPETIKANLRKCYEMLKPGGMLNISTGSVILSTKENFDIRHIMVECLTEAGFGEFKYTNGQGTNDAFSTVDQSRAWYDQNAVIYRQAEGFDAPPVDRNRMIDMGIQMLALKT